MGRPPRGRLTCGVTAPPRERAATRHRIGGRDRLPHTASVWLGCDHARSRQVTSGPAPHRRAGGVHRAPSPQPRALRAGRPTCSARVPMTWMNKWSGGFPLYLDHARGNRISDVDGHDLRRLRPRRHRGDGRALAAATVEAVAAPVRRPRRASRRCCRATRRAGGRRRADPPLRDAPVAASPSRPPTPTGGRSAWPAWPPADRRSSSSRTATTARSTRPSPLLGVDGKARPRPGNVGPRSTSTSRPARRRVQRPRGLSSASSPTATSPPSSPSRR